MIACDFETYSPLDLTVVGVHNYASHPKTGVHCFSYGTNQDDIKLWREGDEFPSDLRQYILDGGKFSAWNARFEILVWNLCAVRKYGWPEIDPKQFCCTMAQAYASSYPGKLSEAALALGIPQQKDIKGQRTMLRLCQERKAGSGTFWNPTLDPVAFKMLYEYNMQDVRVELAIREKLPELNPFEAALWDLDYRINEEVGVPLDVASVKKAKNLASAEAGRLDEALAEATGHVVTSCNQSVALRDWANRHRGVKLLGVAKADVASALADHRTPAKVKEALRIRQEASKSSTKKLDTMLDLVDKDGNVKGTTQYHGANTGRWAGRGIQIQNFPRGYLSPEEVDDVIANIDNRDYIQIFYGNPLDVISSSLRGMICAPEGKKFISADYNSIEARVLAWRAGEEKVLEIFRTTGKLYEHAAAGMFKVPLEEVTKSQRQIGKVAVLALGYQGGVVAFQSMAKNYGVIVSDEEAEDIKKKWRGDNQNIVRLWSKRMRQAISAIRGVEDAGSPFSMRKGNLFFKLPSGREICYPEARATRKLNGALKAATERLRMAGEDMATIDLAKVKKLAEKIVALVDCSGMPDSPWAEHLWFSDAVQYASVDPVTKKWSRVETYGGSLVENEVQAISRDILAEALVRLDKAGYKVCMHVHDEITSIIADSRLEARPDLLAEYCAIMSDNPPWAKGLPLSCEGWIAKRFRK